MAFDFTSGRWTPSAVLRRHDSAYRGAIVTLHTDAGAVTATAYHPFWVIEGHELSARPRPKELAEREQEGLALPGRWVNSHDLLAGDLVATRHGPPLRLLRIEQRFEESFRVVNLTIEAHPTFAVGDDALLVHNTGGCPNLGDGAKAPNRTVIGKVKDLDNLAPGENTLLKHLPDQGTPRANWRQNSSVLRQEIRKGNPIRDASLNPDGTLKNYPGSFLDAERNLLRNQGWTFDPSTGLWSPAK